MRRALLIGAQTKGLSGVENDVKAMAQALEQRKFVITRCEAENASRAGILDAYGRLIAEAGADDSVFVFYSGHGGFYRPPDYERVVRPRVDMQYIVPVDFDDSTEGDFRGITSFELSSLLRALTGRTKNVAVVLDCCHAAHMSRDPQMRVKATDRPAPYHIIAAHLDRLRRTGEPIDDWTPLGNQDAVRIVACAPDQSAYEYANDAGIRMGMLTESLTVALAEAGDAPVTWSTIMERVRRRVLALMPTQRPEAEGPARRLLFDVAEADPVATLPVTVSGTDRVRLDCAALLGTRVGDEFAIMPADSAGPDDGTKVGDVSVDALDAVAAWGTLRRVIRGAVVPLGARAHLTRATAPAMPVRLAQAGPGVAELRDALAADTRVRLAAPDEHCPVEVRVDAAGGLTVWDGYGPLHEPRAADTVGIRRVLRDLRRLARVHALRGLTEDPRYALDSPLTVEFGLVDGGTAKPLSTSGAVLYVGQHVYVRIRNDGPRTVYVSLFDIGVSAKVELLTNASPSGVPVDPGKEHVFGWNDLTGRLTGAPLGWPEDLDRGQPRPETLLAVVSSTPQDLRVFEQDGVPRGADARPSPLERLFDQMATGESRDLRGEYGSAVRYAVRTIDFELVPTPPPQAEEASFQVDERPEASVRLLSPRGAAPATVALRVSDLVVHHNRAFRSADIRLDTLVLTGGVPTRPAYRAHTQRLANIRDGQRLPMDRMLVYHGPAVDYLDIAVWVSRDSSGSLALSDLLRDRMADAQTQTALAQLGGLLLTAPQAAVAAAAVGASAIVVNTAYRLLRAVVGDSIGLYRTTLLAHERFGAGRHPGQNAVRAQDFSFAYTVEDVT